MTQKNVKHIKCPFSFHIFSTCPWFFFQRYRRLYLSCNKVPSRKIKKKYIKLNRVYFNALRIFILKMLPFRNANILDQIWRFQSQLPSLLNVKLTWADPEVFFSKGGSEVYLCLLGKQGSRPIVDKFITQMYFKSGSGPPPPF